MNDRECCQHTLELARSRGIMVASWLVMASAGLHSRLVWCVSRLQRLASASFATTTPAAS
jgi:hypothetical protein